MTKLTTDPGYTLAFVVPYEAYYRRVVDGVSVTVQKSADDGGCAWEFGIVQVSNIGLRVEIFDDAWAAFAEIPEFFAELARLGRSDLNTVRELLDEMGFTDATQRAEDAR